MHAATTDRFPAARATGEHAHARIAAPACRTSTGPAAAESLASPARSPRSSLATGRRPRTPPSARTCSTGCEPGRGQAARGREAARPGRRAAAAEAPIAIPYQKTIPHNLPVVDPSLDIVSPPLACLDQDTIWSQPGNLYTQIVDLSDVDNSRSMIAPGNAEDSAGPFRTSQIDLWVSGTTHPAPLSRERSRPWPHRACSSR